jgi:hypothetical protein
MGVAMMKTLNAAALAVLALFAAAPALAQSSQEFRGSICEIDTSVLNLTPPYLTPDNTKSVFTLNSTKSCSGVASKRNIKLVCMTPLPPNYNRGDRTATKFPCTINPDQCGVAPKGTDTANPPYVTTRDTVLKVRGGVAELICHYKP